MDGEAPLRDRHRAAVHRRDARADLAHHRHRAQQLDDLVHIVGPDHEAGGRAARGDERLERGVAELRDRMALAIDLFGRGERVHRIVAAEEQHLEGAADHEGLVLLVFIGLGLRGDADILALDREGGRERRLLCALDSGDLPIDFADLLLEIVELLLLLVGQGRFAVSEDGHLVDDLAPLRAKRRQLLHQRLYLRDAAPSGAAVGLPKAPVRAEPGVSREFTKFRRRPGDAAPSRGGAAPPSRPRPCRRRHPGPHRPHRSRPNRLPCRAADSD